MDKIELLRQVLARLREQLATMQHAAQSSHDAATGSESKSESKYDTRGLEASYLAGAQAEQCEKLAQAIHCLSGFTPPENTENSTVQPGCIVEVESAGDIQHYFLLPSGGGITLDYQGYELITLTPDTPIYQAILGSKQGDLSENQNFLVLDIL